LKKRLLQRIGEKTLGNVDLQIMINSKTKPNESIPNINECNIMNSIFSRICLVSRTSGMLFDDGEVQYRVYDSWLSQIYKQTIAWKWTRPLKILQCQYAYLDSYAKQIKVHLTLLHTPHVVCSNNFNCS